jgi:polyhydroxyalkanoate synthesis regulator phasin
MTRRERLEMVIANTITDELIEECKAELVKMDEANAKRKEKVDPRKAENAEIMEKIVSVLAESTEPMQIDPIVEALGIADLTRQRVSSLCTILVKDGRITSEDVKVKGKGKRKAYSLA